MKYTIRLVIADDHEIFRDGLVLMLSKDGDIILEGQAENGLDLIHLVQEKKPDVILTDIKMPRMDGIQAAKALLAENPDQKIIALSMFDEENLIVEMLEAGAKGYLLKNADKREIIEAIEQVYEGNSYYCKHTSARLAKMIVNSSFNPYKKTEKAVFTERETVIIKLTCQQLTAQQIGERLFLSKRTVEGYRTKILEKMNVKNTTGVVIYALKHGLVEEKDIL
ncbi:MAG: response regulator transcription factor [Bacteroidetes bacterium]|nr:response regulator transcription factor [Bacteroidota bacterium]MBS1975469.1 response regulator transcription factor [Bacteroidota bacterium]